MNHRLPEAHRAVEDRRAIDAPAPVGPSVMDGPDGERLMAGRSGLKRVQVVGWAPPWVLVSEAGEEKSATVEVLRGQVDELHRMLPATDEEAVIVFTQRWPLGLENGRLRRTAALGAEIVLVERPDGSAGWNPGVGSIAAVRGRPAASVDHVASLKSPDDRAGLDTEVAAIVEDWAARKCCGIDGCHTVLPSRQRVCDSHVGRWRQDLLDEIEAVERRAVQAEQASQSRFRERQRPTSPQPSGSTTYQSVPCISCGGDAYRRDTREWGYWSRRMVTVFICEGCGWRYSTEPWARSGPDPAVVSRTEIEEIVRSGWPIRAIGDHSLRTVDAPHHWPVLRIGRRLRTEGDEAKHQHRSALSELEEAVREARRLADLPQDVGNPDKDVERCAECGWPFGAQHRYDGGPSCRVLVAMTHLSNGEWTRRPNSGRGVRALNDRWPNQYYGPIAFGHSSQYGLGIRQGQALEPIVDGETAAVTLARIRLRAHVDGVDLGEALQLVLDEASIDAFVEAVNREVLDAD